MLKTLGNTESTTRPGEGIVGIGGDSRVGCDGSKLDRNEIDRSEIDNGEIDGGKIDDEIGKKGQKTSKSKNLFKSKKLSKSKKT